MVEYPFGIDLVPIVSAIRRANHLDQLRIWHLERADIVSAIRASAILGIDLGALGADYWVPDCIDALASSIIVMRPLAVPVGFGFV